MVAVSLVDNLDIIYADPWDGLLHRRNAASFYATLEGQKWYCYATGTN